MRSPFVLLSLAAVLCTPALLTAQSKGQAAPILEIEKAWNGAPASSMASRVPEQIEGCALRSASPTSAMFR